MKLIARTAAVFIILAGVMLLFAPEVSDPELPKIPPDDAAAFEPRPPPTTRVMLQSLDELHEAQRALDDENYRDAREHVAAARDSLAAHLARAAR